MSEIFKLLTLRTSCSKRELYYRDPQLTLSQRTVDKALQDICFLLEANLWELNVFSSSKGLVAGPLRFRSKHQESVDCFNSLGTQIPADVLGLMEISVDAELVLIVEKDTVFRRLLEDGILNRMSKKLLLVTVYQIDFFYNFPYQSIPFSQSKGYPDVGTRLLLQKIWTTYKIPMFALVDADPYGIEIYCVYKFGSLALSHQSQYLAVPAIRWIGVRPSHIPLLGLKQLPLNARDRARIVELLKRPYIGKVGCELARELKLMDEMDAKAEIESLADISVDYLINEYLPSQLKVAAKMVT